MSALGAVAALALTAGSVVAGESTYAAAPARSPGYQPVAGGAAAAAASGHPLAAAITVKPRVRQLITISSPAWSSTSATLRTWRRPAGGTWVRVHGPVRVVLGYSGWVVAADRVQSTGTSPAGIFRLPFAFGRLSDPGTSPRYRQYDGNDWWPYDPRDPATYNIYQAHKARSSHWRTDFSEHLADYQRQYAYAIVVGFNLPTGIHYSATRRQRVATTTADTSQGGGIFLHVQGAGLTAGCVAMPRAQLRWLLEWLNPQRAPRVAMGPRHYLVSQ